ncbi:hypothetical protein FRACYDRAFT_237739 [Fragilariopsis cylindrus CCMP1102]|uniref:Uncharacterized protein n=1 Tax=Fragilariopsis cylindrus CCMP1102 TaxID=635003 RepID=A0A1E7FGM6_9STRA|nr:hypothetical protein FRACYDRAFT_237739 [Fragilariopsis cylindrus CCMP1102]|eukprot:OEU17329.1 hypothetical protein FRACYDRAFT_237739 [Fragilariopsis cylindrus CCMP1102]
MKFNINDIIHVLKSEGVVHEEDIITGAPRIKKKVSLRYDDFALLVNENDFLEDPVQTLDNAIQSLSPSKLQHKIEGLRLMQRILAADQPNSLFVPALAKEIVQTMSEPKIEKQKWQQDKLVKRRGKQVIFAKRRVQ